MTSSVLKLALSGHRLPHL